MSTPTTPSPTTPDPETMSTPTPTVSSTSTPPSTPNPALPTYPTPMASATLFTPAPMALTTPTIPFDFSEGDHSAEHYRMAQYLLNTIGNKQAKAYKKENELQKLQLRQMETKLRTYIQESEERSQSAFEAILAYIETFQASPPEDRNNNNFR
ncbi:hypothetical protein L596_005416 [Steinernema carpocapsae]|uniref:Uncharacterized protein n=1 Tax=Steinernema carpocapsae TaxID=34508 RepID=A0A4U8V2K3_STECR|nr:hypothetical protein L596_005416 [Steinernema carpocapsae]